MDSNNVFERLWEEMDEEQDAQRPVTPATAPDTLFESPVQCQTTTTQTFEQPPVQPPAAPAAQPASSEIAPAPAPVLDFPPTREEVERARRVLKEVPGMKKAGFVRDPHTGRLRFRADPQASAAILRHVALERAHASLSKELGFTEGVETEPAPEAEKRRVLGNVAIVGVGCLLGIAVAGGVRSTAEAVHQDHGFSLSTVIEAAGGGLLDGYATVIDAGTSLFSK